MVPALSLWLPILLSAVLVFVVSSIIHMVLSFWHRDDFQTLPDEDAVMDALRPFAIPEGEYVMPRACSSKEMQDPAYKAKLDKGPVAFITICPKNFQMGKALFLWFLYSLLVGLFAAYVAGRALGPGAPYLEVFRVTSTVAFSGYALALLQNSIWYKRKWMTTARQLVDGFVYALVTAGTFGWLWPAG
jgi:chromate transport protein ChrA